LETGPERFGIAGPERLETAGPAGFGMVGAAAAGTDAFRNAVPTCEELLEILDSKLGSII
jgi:hypothetical protein